MHNLYAIGFDDENLINVNISKGCLFVTADLFDENPDIYNFYENALEALHRIQQWDKSKVTIWNENVVGHIIAEKNGTLPTIEDLANLKIYVIGVLGEMDVNDDGTVNGIAHKYFTIRGGSDGGRTSKSNS